MKLADSLNPATQAENIKKLNAGLEAVDAKTLPGTSTATAGQILKLTGENKTPAWADEYTYTPPAYSETEVNTGQKWIDGKNVYSLVIMGTFPAEATNNYVLINKEISLLLNSSTFYIASNGNIINFVASYINSTNSLVFNVSSGLVSRDYYGIIYYTKPDPAPETREDDTPEEVKETKTRKKTQNKKED